MLALSETWDKQAIKSVEFAITGHRLFRKFRGEGRKWGVSRIRSQLCPNIYLKSHTNIYLPVTSAHWTPLYPRLHLSSSRGQLTDLIPSPYTTESYLWRFSSCCPNWRSKRWTHRLGQTLVQCPAIIIWHKVTLSDSAHVRHYSPPLWCHRLVLTKIYEKWLTYLCFTARRSPWTESLLPN